MLKDVLSIIDKMTTDPGTSITSDAWVVFSFIILLSVILSLLAVLILILVPRNKKLKESEESTSDPIKEYSCLKAAEQTRDELIFDLVKRRYDEERQRTKDLDSKADMLAGFTSIVLSLLIGAGALQLLNLIIDNQLIGIPYFVGVGILLASVISNLMAVRTKPWYVVPDTEDLLSFFITRSYKETLRTNASEMSQSIEDTHMQNEKKVVWIRIGWYLLVAGLSIFFVMLGLLVFGVKASQLNIPAN